MTSVNAASSDFVSPRTYAALKAEMESDQREILRLKEELRREKRRLDTAYAANSELQAEVRHLRTMGPKAYLTEWLRPFDLRPPALRRDQKNAEEALFLRNVPRA